MRHRSTLHKKGIPLALHGDGVAVVGVNKTWTKSVDAYSWTSVLSHGHLVSSSFLIFVLYSQYLVKHANMNAQTTLHKLLAWSFYWLAVGKWPTRDCDDKAFPPESAEARRAAERVYLADGFFGVLWVMQGDLDHMNKAYGFPAAGAANRCACCKANTSDIPWTDARMRTAKWLSTIWDDPGWLASRPDVCPLFKLPGMGISSFIPDIMHCVYLGTYQYTFGSVLQYLTHRLLGGSAQQNCEQLWRDFGDYYRAHPTPEALSELRVSRYYRGVDKFPLLKGRAAELRHLPAALLAVFEKYMDDTIEQHKHIHLAIKSACDMEELIDAHMREYRWAASVSAEYKRLVNTFVQAVQALGHYFHNQGLFLFHMTIKFHYMLHISLLSEFVNPVSGWCFQGESMMQVVKKVCAASHRGSTPIRASVKIMRKYALGLGLALNDDVWRR